MEVPGQLTEFDNNKKSRGIMATTKDMTGSVVIVGAGIAGMQAALDLANAGYYVHLVDRSPTVGGLMAQLDKTFPTNDCTI